MSQNELATVPPWVRSFMVHVVKRCCGIIICWIDQMQTTQAIDVICEQSYNMKDGLRQNGQGPR